MPYPSSLDGLRTDIEDRQESVSGSPKAGRPKGAGYHAGLHIEERAAINRMEAELGLEPSGSYDDVAARLAAIAEALEGVGLTKEAILEVLGYTPEDSSHRVQALSGESESEYPSEKAVQLALATKQPLDADLTAIAALSTTEFGRSVLALANAAAGRTLLGLGSAAVEPVSAFQGADSDLTAIAALSTTEYGRSLLTAASAAAARTLLGAASVAEAESALQKSIWRALGIKGGGRFTNAAASGKKYVLIISGTNAESIEPSASATVADPFEFTYVAADHGAGLKARIVAHFYTGATAPGKEVTLGLYESEGGSAHKPGTLVAESSAGKTPVKEAPPGTKLETPAVALVDGKTYIVGVTLSGTPEGSFSITYRLEGHN